MYKMFKIINKTSHVGIKSNLPIEIELMPSTGVSSSSYFLKVLESGPSCLDVSINRFTVKEST